MQLTDFLQFRDNIDLLRTYQLTLSARDTVRCRRPFFAERLVCPVPVVDSSVYELQISGGEDLRDRNLLRTSFCTVMTGCAWNGCYGAEGSSGFEDGPHLVAGERLKILHIGKIILHLRDIRHAGENGKNAVKRSRETDRPGGVGSIRIRLFQNILDLLRRICKVLIVDLQLDELCVGMIRQDLVEKFRPVVK